MTGYNFKGSRVSGTVKDRYVELNFNYASERRGINISCEGVSSAIRCGGGGSGGFVQEMYDPVRTTYKDEIGFNESISYIGPGITPYDFAVKNGFKIFGSADKFKAYKGDKVVMEYGYDN